MPYVGIQLIGDADLEHHGIKGQRWGVRRYQNSDGSLTSAGRARYGSSTSSAARRVLTGNYTTHDRAYNRSRMYAAASKMAKSRAAAKRTSADFEREMAGEFKNQSKLSKFVNGNYEKAWNRTAKRSERQAARLEKRAAKFKDKSEAYSRISAARLKYDRSTSTGKMALQNFLLTGNAAETYRDARALGATRGQALLSTGRKNRKRALAGGY